MKKKKQQKKQKKTKTKYKFKKKTTEKVIIKRWKQNKINNTTLAARILPGNAGWSCWYNNNDNNNEKW